MKISRGQFITDVLPELALELMELLRGAGENELARTVPDLRFHSWCGCGEQSCTSFYTAPPPNGPYGPTHRNISLAPQRGMIILDVVDGEIMFIEILDRPVRG